MRALVESLITTLKSATALEIAEVVFAKGKASTLPSARTLVQRELNAKVALGHLERLGTVYRTKGCTSTHHKHSQIINKHITPFFKLPLEVYAHKEHWIAPVYLRSDVVVFLKYRNKCRCAIVEVAETETPESLVNKCHIWKGWDGANDYLTNLFKLPRRVPYFDFVISSGDFCPQNAITYEQFMSEVRKEVKDEMGA